MCTVTYLPYREGFILTHNRDEAPTRSPHDISRQRIGADTLLFPRDTKAGGAWIGTTRSGKTACLLNGAFVKHKHEPPYRRSRGLMLLDFFESPDAERFFADYDLDGIEPFTQLFFRREKVVEFRWDGTSRHYLELDPSEPKFWCSATLYSPDMQVVRAAVFQHWLQEQNKMDQNERLPASIFHLHRTGSINDPENDYVMNRSGRVQTVSITQIVYSAGKARMHYRDLLEMHQDRQQITFKKG